ncbi:Uncharacterised protein [Providencia rettgeri]|nr:Uncharacterised protein [Providencia rettgeri]
MEKFSQELLRVEHFVLRVLRFYLLALLIFFLAYYPV